ncbi:MAG: 6-bladed beta-propeller [Gemmatimonadota bacterium]|jgi:hypothetical protein
MRSFLIFGLIATIGCVDHEGPMNSVRDSVGIVIVESARPLFGDEFPILLSEEPRLNLGDADAPVEYQYESIEDAVSIPGLGYAVADRRRNQIFLYDESGNHRRTVGGPGGGPGEFQALGSLRVLGDSLLAFDWRTGRLTIFDLDGGLLATTQLQETDDSFHPIHTYNLSGVLGRELVVAPWAIMPLGHSDVGPYWDSAAVLIYGLDGRVQRELPEPYLTEMFVGTQGVSGRPFGSRTAIAVQGDRLFLGTGKTFEINVFNAAGTLERIIRRSWTPRSVTSAVVDSLIEFRIRQAGVTSRADPRVEGFRRMLESAPVPDQMPAFSWLLSDPQGRLWVREYQAPYEDVAQKWILFDREGAWVGSVSMPDRFDVRAFGETEVLGVWRDELNVQHFQVYGMKLPEK